MGWYLDGWACSARTALLLSVLIDPLAVAGLPCQTCGKASFVTDIATDARLCAEPMDRYLAASCSSSCCIVGRAVI